MTNIELINKLISDIRDLRADETEETLSVLDILTILETYKLSASENTTEEEHHIHDNQSF